MVVVVVVVAYEILVSAQGPLFGFLGFRAKGLGPGLDNSFIAENNKQLITCIT